MIKEYGLPFVLALLVHMAAGATLWGKWGPEPPEVRDLVRPNVIRAELMVMEPPPVQSTPSPSAQQARADEQRRQAEQEAARREEQRREEQRQAEVRRAEERRAEERRAEERRVAEREEAERREAERREAERQEAARREARRREEEARQRRLDELAASTFDESLARESETLAEAREAEAAQSYSQGIYRLVVANWSRPPSARTGMQTLLQVELVPTGEVVGVTILESSGSAAFDRSAEQAVRRVGQFDVPNDSRLFERHFRRFQLLFNPGDLLR